MTKYSYDYGEEAALIEKKLAEQRKPPADLPQRDVLPHSVLTCILLDLIPVFNLFFAFYWMARLNNDARDLAGDYPSTPGWKVVLFYFLTFGLYAYYWVLKQSKRIDRIKAANGDRFNQGNGLLYTIPFLFGLGWITLAMMQSQINEQL